MESFHPNYFSSVGRFFRAVLSNQRGFSSLSLSSEHSTAQIFEYHLEDAIQLLE